MNETQYLLWFIVTALTLLSGLAIGTLIAAGILPATRRKQPASSDDRIVATPHERSQPRTLPRSTQFRLHGAHSSTER